MLAEDAFLFSASPDSSTHLLPDSVSQRFGDLADRLGIATTLHKLRHYSATELIAAGVDPRTVAGRLGHGGGGTTTLRYYSAWVSESDQRAASTLRARMPSRSVAAPTTAASRHPYLKLAALLRERIAASVVPVGEFLPGQKVLAAKHGVSVGTAHRAVAELARDGLVEVVPGHGFRVVAVPVPEPPTEVVDSTASTPVPDRPTALLDLVLRRHGQVVSHFSAEADPDDSADLTDLVLSAIQRSGGDIARAAAYELEMRKSAADGLLRTFVVSRRRAHPRR